MSRTTIFGIAFGTLWATGELAAARLVGRADVFAIFASHAVLGAIAVLAPFVALSCVPRWRARRDEFACALGVGAVVLAVAFVRMHFAWLTRQSWLSMGHALALLGALTLGVLAAFAAAASMRRLRHVQWPVHPRIEPWATGAFVLLLLPAARSVIPHFDVNVEAAPAKCSSPYNVLVITVDTLRADHLGAYGYALPTDTDLERFGFTRFDHAYAAAPWTRPATATILTGLYPSAHTAESNDAHLPSEAVTLAERLREAGFATAHCAGNLNASGVFGMAQGAEFTVRDPYLLPHPLSGTTLGELLRRRTYRLQDARDLCRMALAFLDSVGSRRFYLYFHCDDPHTPYDPPREELERFAPDYRGRVFTKPRPDLDMSQSEVEHMVARYDGDIANATSSIARLLDDLDRRGELESTLVILTADHGESFGQHERWNHSNSLYDELLRVPLFVRPPMGAKRESIVLAPASQIDIVPTVLDYLGFAREESLLGRSLRPAIEGRACGASEERLLLAECRRIDAWAARLGPWKLIVSGSDPEFELYDLESDPDETHDLAKDRSQAERVREIHRRGLALRDALGAQSLAPEQREASPRERAMLRELGYVDDR